MNAEGPVRTPLWVEAEVGKADREGALRRGAVGLSPRPPHNLPLDLRISLSFSFYELQSLHTVLLSKVRF